MAVLDFPEGFSLMERTPTYDNFPIGSFRPAKAQSRNGSVT